jgi:hypothetical protein
MPSSATILSKLEHSHATDVALGAMPGAAIGLETLDNTHATIASYSEEGAKAIPYGAEAGWWRKILLGITPLFLAFGWVAFFKAARQLSQARKRSFDLWLNAGVSFVAAAGATIVTAFLFSGLAYLAPYLLAAVLGLNALQGLYYTAKHLYLAYKDRENRWQHLKEAGKSFLGIAMNTLAMILNIVVFQTAKLLADGIRDFASDIFSIFMHYQEFMDLINGPVMSGVATVKGVGLGWFGTLVLGMIFSASKINQQSWHMINGTHPDEPTFEREALKDMRRIVSIIKDPGEHPLKRFFFALTAPITLPLYAVTSFVYAALIRPAAALAVGIPELLLRGLWRAGKWAICGDEPATSGSSLEQSPTPSVERERAVPVTVRPGRSSPAAAKSAVSGVGRSPRQPAVTILPSKGSSFMKFQPVVSPTNASLYPKLPRTSGQEGDRQADCELSCKR